MLTILFRFAAALTLLTVAGCAPAEPEPGTPYHHTADGFRNPPGSPERYPWHKRTGWVLSRLLSLTSEAEASGLPNDHSLSREDALAGYRALEGQDTITWIGHMTALLRLDGKTVLTDPWLTERAAPLPGFGPKRFVPPAFGFDDLPKIDVVMVSHSHYDHFDLATIAGLPGKQEITAVVPLGLGKYFRERGYRHVVELDWHDKTEVDGLTITAMPVIHWSKRSLFSSNKTLWSAFAIESAAGRRVYVGGDAEYGPVYKALADRYGGFDLALLSIGAYLPRRVMHGSHCLPETCLQLGLDLDAHAMAGLHWGTVKLSDEPLSEPPARFLQAAKAAGVAKERIWIMKIGETRRLPSRPRVGS